VRAEAKHVLRDPIVENMHEDHKFNRDERRTRLVELREEKRVARESKQRRPDQRLQMQPR
jgi:hypothetical protein